MQLRSVLIFPEFTAVDSQKIATIRRQYDTLYKHIRPHISLVFPFLSQETDEDIKNAVETIIKHTQPFSITLSTVGGDLTNGYVWLNVTEGQEIVAAIHDKLYANARFKPFYRRDIPYQPHITIGQAMPPNKARQLRNKLQIEQMCIDIAHIDHIAIETILPNDDSELIANFKL
ncbi:2'-5' RNA ligase family protein [Leuconostoc rapi]|uniref:2'-5' RNA ligase family protein n=1 Tax=Leuconostoc rapi TaxID=1406906 RepID=UPI001957ED4D|nr:2'-5' RNA ligase family protein [Leuconostoc rapi]MBM7436608.1 2'-5' RNA ligase [Leuconostoc rapi]